MTINKTIDKGNFVTFRTYTLRWKEVGGFYSVAVGWCSVQTDDSFSHRTWVYLTPMAGKTVSIEVASLKDGLTLVKSLGGVVNER